MTEKELQGIEIFFSLPPEFNIAPVVKWDGRVDYEALVDWFAARDERDELGKR